jgi:hypothetical protein
MSLPSISGAVKVVEGFLVHVVERKVKAATTAATIASAAVSLLGLYVFHGVVPDWVTALVGTAVTGALTFAAGYIAKHTPRTIAPVGGVPNTSLNPGSQATMFYTSTPGLFAVSPTAPPVSVTAPDPAPGSPSTPVVPPAVPAVPPVA